MNRKEIYSSKTYEIYLNLIDKHMKNQGFEIEYKPVIITALFDKELNGRNILYNPNTGMYEYKEYHEDVSTSKTESNRYELSLSPEMVNKYLKIGYLAYAEPEEIKGFQDEAFKQPTELEVLRDEIDGLKSTIYLMRKEFEDVVDNFNEKLHEYYNSKPKFWLF